MMEEIIRQSLCPKFLFKEGNKKLTEVPPQCNLWDARHLTCCGDLQRQHGFMFRNHLKSSNLLLHLFKSYSSTNIICAKACCWPSSNVWCLVCIGQPRSCAQCTLRWYELKCWRSEQRKVYWKGQARSKDAHAQKAGTPQWISGEVF